MTTNDYFDQEMRVMTPDKVLQPRAFALCWDTADQITKMELYGGDARSLYMLNSELLARTYTAPSLTLE